jgi:demethylmenaquinone methyltransferase/2-methoxy-6-polyprenyl-1,4-benzoquinol methylase
MQCIPPALLTNFRRRPNREASLRSYRQLHPGYDDACRWIEGIRAQALGLLALQEGDTVLDVACGTGAMLPALGRAVGARGRVIGIEQSPEMAALAASRAAQAPSPNVRVVIAPAEEARIEVCADAVLFCYTHDVLQSERAIENVMRHTRAGARVVVAGTRLLGWWAAPLNLWKLWRSRRYLSTYTGLRDPAARLRRYCPDLTIHATRVFGTSYLAAGHAGLGAIAP